MRPAAPIRLLAPEQSLDLPPRDAYTSFMKKRGLLGRLGHVALVAGLGGPIAGLGGCGQGDSYLGPAVRVTGSFNNWAKGELAPALTWDGAMYKGEVRLPGNALQLRLYSPYTGDLLDIRSLSSAPGVVPGVPSILAIAPTTPSGLPTQGDKSSRLNTPVPANYLLEYNPARQLLRIDFADGAELGQPAGAAQLIAALRDSDRLTGDEIKTRAGTLTASLKDIKLPLVVGAGDSQGLTFLQVLDPVDLPELSLVGDFNQWDESSDPMTSALGGAIAYLGRVVTGIRLEYRFALHGKRISDQHNDEIAWDGAYLPPNLQNLLGGNVGDFNSVAFSPGYTEQGSRLKLLTVPDSTEDSGTRELYVYLPAGYDPNGPLLPSLYIHDGKDAIVRGLYNQALDRLIRDKQIPKAVAVFIPAKADANKRLAEYASFGDPYFANITPAGSTYEAFITGPVLRAVEGAFRVSTDSKQRAMLGVDMAGPLTFHIAWNSRTPPFMRLASQSGRFGWGQPNSYAQLLTQPPLGDLPLRMSFDWADDDNFQVAAHADIQAGLYPKIDRSQVNFTKQISPPAASTPWDTWRGRLDTSLTFLLHDLVGN